MGTYAMAQNIITVEPENATAWDEITLTLDASISCPANVLYGADSVMMHSGLTIDGASWSDAVAFDGMGADGVKPKLTLVSGGFQRGITMTPVDATPNDTVTITLDAKASCPMDALLMADSVMIHSGVTVGEISWQNAVEYNGLGFNGQQPKLMHMGDSVWSISFVPVDFYGLGDTVTAVAINCVFNGGTWDAGEGKAYAEDSSCMDFALPFGGPEAPKWQITFTPSAFYDIEEGTEVTAINCVFNGGAWDGREGKDWDPENPETCIDFTIPLGNVGINENPRMSSYNLYPNPVGNQLTINNIGDVNKIEVYNIIGKMVKSVDNLSTNGVTIVTSNLTSGVYFVTFHNESGVQTTKFVKN